MSLALVPLASYLIGSLPVSMWVARRWSGRDLRRVGSGNPGATNVLRIAGRLPAALALAGDAAKGGLPVLMGHAVGAGEGALALAVLSAVLGHVFSPWLGFRGGKGVATAFGGFLFLAPVAAAVALAVFLVLVYRTRYVSLGSMIAIVVFPLSWLLLSLYAGRPAPGDPTLAAVVAVGGLVVWRHAANIRRLRGGREARLGAATENTPEVRP